MSKNEWFKVFGAETRQDQLIELSKHNVVVIYGFGKDGEQGYNYRKNYGDMPDKEALKKDIIDLVNANVDERILKGFVWKEKNVCLSSENQFNFKAAYDIAVQTGGANLPLKMKLGEKGDETPIYYTFEDVADFGDFFTSAMAYIQACLAEGWTEKDSIDIDSLYPKEAEDNE